MSNITYSYPLFLSMTSNSRITLKKSPSIVKFIDPPMAFVRLLAIESPSPFPSVYLDLSPLTNLSISSSGVIFNCSLDVFLKINLTSL